MNYQTRLIFLSYLLVSSACSGPQVRTVLSLPGLTCSSCGPHSVRSLKALKGVHTVTFDKQRVELYVTYNPNQQSPQTLSQTVTQLGYVNVLGPGKGNYAPETQTPPGADIKTLKPQTQVPNIEELVVRGRVTIIDFFAVWCGPCREVDRFVKEVMTRRDDIAYRRIDIGQWSSAVAKAYLGDVPELPYVLVFDTVGQRIAEISGLDLVRLKAAINRGRAR